jgi:hypothetical protein
MIEKILSASFSRIPPVALSYAQIAE